jgi:hypothetical protein
MRTSRRTVLIAVALGLLTTPAVRAVTLDEMKKTYKDALWRIQEQHMLSTLKLQQDYAKGLDRLQLLAQKQGSIERVMAFRNEKKRFEKDKGIPETDDNVMPAVTKVRASYRRAAMNYRIQEASAIVALTTRYDAALENFQRQRTTAGKFEEALAAKAERDRVGKSDVFTGALPLAKLTPETGGHRPVAMIAGKLPKTLAKGLVLYYPFDKDEGKVVSDASGNKLNATVKGPEWTAKSRHGGGYNFTGSGYILIGNPKALNITGDQTIAFWINPGALNTRRNPYAKAYGGTGTMTLETDGALSYYYGTGGQNRGPYMEAQLAKKKLAVGEWSHVTLVRDLKNMKVTWYKNGQAMNTTTARFEKAVASSNPAYLGRGYVAPFFGQLDEFMVFNRALSAAEVARLFRALSGTGTLRPATRLTTPGTKRSLREPRGP